MYSIWIILYFGQGGLDFLQNEGRRLRPELRIDRAEITMPTHPYFFAAKGYHGPTRHAQLGHKYSNVSSKFTS